MTHNNQTISWLLAKVSDCIECRSFEENWVSTRIELLHHWEPTLCEHQQFLPSQIVSQKTQKKVATFGECIFPSLPTHAVLIMALIHGCGGHFCHLLPFLISSIKHACNVPAVVYCIDHRCYYLIARAYARLLEKSDSRMFPISFYSAANANALVHFPAALLCDRWPFIKLRATSRTR